MGKANSKQNLSPEDFDELVKSTDFTSAEIDEWFEKFKHDFPKGYISPREFKAIYEKLYPEGDADLFAKHIFRVYDKDDDGVISFAEFLTTLHVSARGSPQDKLRSTFRMYDIDNNGFVTAGELTQILTSIYRSRSGTDYKERAKMDAASIICQLDANNDKKLSVDEFVSATTTCSLVMDILNAAK